MLKIVRPPAADPPPAPLPPESPRAPTPAATDGTFYSMLDMLGRQAAPPRKDKDRR